MSEEGSGNFSLDHYNDGSHTEHSPEENDALSSTLPSLDVDIQLKTGGGGGREKQKTKSGMSLEERARVLSSGGSHRRPADAAGSTAPPQPPPPFQPAQPVPSNGPSECRITPYTVQPSQPPPQPVHSESFHVENAYVPSTPPPAASDPQDSWVMGGSLKPLDNEEVFLRRAGALADVLNVYNLVSYVMLTNRRIVIKQRSTLFGMNLHTVESSFLYENLRHITVQRVTNFRFLWLAIVTILLSIVFFSLVAVVSIYAVLGVVCFLVGIFAVYWFFIFYNSNSLVVDFSKGELVGSWTVPAGKGAFVTKSLILHIDHCFDIMYSIYDQAKCVFAENNA